MGTSQELTEDVVRRPLRKVQTQAPGGIRPARRPKGKERQKDGGACEGRRRDKAGELKRCRKTLYRVVTEWRAH